VAGEIDVCGGGRRREVGGGCVCVYVWREGEMGEGDFEEENFNA
jgi:hypothetical protein